MAKTQKKNKKRTNDFNKIIDKIQKVRKKNNKNWMDILKLAFASDPIKAGKIFKEIYKEDKSINELAKKLTK
tara:strand:+ start:259 stop:474 length:216 start_codon:yes stop_codon:yes gene_type:complete